MTDGKNEARNVPGFGFFQVIQFSYINPDGIGDEGIFRESFNRVTRNTRLHRFDYEGSFSFLRECFDPGSDSSCSF